jgi:hypothetical protein
MPVCAWPLTFLKSGEYHGISRPSNIVIFNYISNLIPKWPISVGLILGQRGKEPYLLYAVILCSEECSETFNEKQNGNQ